MTADTAPDGAHSRLGAKLGPTPAPKLTHVEAWLFDLDNTLYPHSCNLFAQIDARMKEFICGLMGCDTEAAHVVQKDLFRRYGTTMRGLMTEHGIAPQSELVKEIFEHAKRSPMVLDQDEIFEICEDHGVVTAA